MVTYICDLHNGYGIGLIVVSSRNKKIAIGLMNKYLSDKNLDKSYNLNYIKENIKKLKNYNVELDYFEGD